MWRNLQVRSVPVPLRLAQRVLVLARQERVFLVRPVWGRGVQEQLELLGRVLQVHSGRVWEVNLAKSRPWNPQWLYLPGAVAFFFLRDELD